MDSNLMDFVVPTFCDLLEDELLARLDELVPLVWLVPAVSEMYVVSV